MFYLFLCALFFLTSGFIEAEELSFYDNSDKFWVHAVNNVNKLKRVQDLYDGVELDVVYIEETGVISIARSARRPVRLILEKYLETASLTPHLGLWLDFKNLRYQNRDDVFKRVEFLVEKFSLKRDRIIVESKDIRSLEPFTDAGYKTSYYLPERFLRSVREKENISDLSSGQRKRIERINDEVVSSGVYAVSVNCLNFSVVNKFITSANSVFLWGPDLKAGNSYHREVISSIIEKDERVEVFLVGE